ncbi:MAG: V-type ATP synthase subunit D, partial [Planctomycetota bacterium]
MLANVNATRMELLRLRKRVALASRGHRLLSEKRDEISRQLIQIAKEIQPLRKRVEAELLETCRCFMLARATMEPEDTKAALEVPTKKFSLAIELANIMNVKVPHLTKEITGQIICYGYATTSGEMDVALLALERAFDHL